MSIADCKHRHHYSPESKQLYKEYFYQLCQCLECHKHFVQVTIFDGYMNVHHVVKKVETKELAIAWIDRAWIDSQP